MGLSPSFESNRIEAVFEEEPMHGHAQVDQTLNAKAIKQMSVEGPSQFVRDQLHDLVDAIAAGTDALNGNLRQTDDDPQVQIVQHGGRVTVTVSTVLYDTVER